MCVSLWITFFYICMYMDTYTSIFTIVLLLYLVSVGKQLLYVFTYIYVRIFTFPYIHRSSRTHTYVYKHCYIVYRYVHIKNYHTRHIFIYDCLYI